MKITADMPAPFSMPPYQLTREQFDHFRELYRPDPASQHRYTKGSGPNLQHFEILQWLGYDVHKWLYAKACAGCDDSLFKIQFSYNLYDEVINKAREEGKL